MSAADQQKREEFFVENEKKMNLVVCKVTVVFALLVASIAIASSFGLFTISVDSVMMINVITLAVIGVYMMLIIFNAPVKLVKHYGLIVTEATIFLMAQNFRFSIYMTYLLAPALSCLYFDRKLTISYSIFGYIMMLAALYFRSEGMVQNIYVEYTRVRYFSAFALGYTMEYGAVCSVFIAIASISRRRQEELMDTSSQVKHIQDTMTKRFAEMIEMRDYTDYTHIERVCRYCELIADKVRAQNTYKIAKHDAAFDNIVRACILHDIGKLKVPDDILVMRRSLTDDEEKQMRIHAEVGGAFVESILNGYEDEEFIRGASEIALFHHEAWDGTGYPYGLRGEEIPLAARIICLADAFDAITSFRCYNISKPLDEAFNEIAAFSGTRYDPKLVDIFMENRDAIIEIFNQTQDLAEK